MASPTDPGVEAPIHDASKDLEHRPLENAQQREDYKRDFLDPSRWWFASTACPLIAGTFGPMANAFSICALVQNWRAYVPPGSTEAHGEAIHDPAWLIAINSISLGCALIANLALLLNMARRLSFAFAQPITIIGFLLSAFLLIALVAVASSSTFRIDPPEQHALTQAFYYGIIAAGLYCIISLLMSVTVVGAMRNHYEKEFKLTISQRTLMLQTIAFMVYLLVGALVFKHVEGWSYLDAVYWADFTLLTVGIGADFVPKTHLGRSLLFPYAIAGIVTLGLVVGSVRTLGLERGKHKMEARMTEKKRARVFSTIDSEQRTIKIGRYRRITFSQKGLTEVQRREQEFKIMREIQHRAARNRQWAALVISTVAAMALWLVGAFVFKKSEKDQGWSYFVSLYFAYTSLLTIGYGDLQPTSNSGKPFFVFWSLLAVPTLTILISNMSDTVVKAFRDFIIWVGTLTVLPGESGTKSTLRATANRVSQGQSLHFGKDPGADRHPRLLPRNSIIEQSETRKLEIEDFTMKRLAGYIEEEVEQVQKADEKGDPVERDTHFYHYALSRELGKVIQDLGCSPPKEYTFEEWIYYLRLIGQDESNPKHHRKPTVRTWTRKKGEPDLGKADGEDVETGQPNTWSWLGTRSPLMGNKTEAEWILEHLSFTLERELKTKENLNDQGQRRPPPISIADLRARASGSSRGRSSILPR